MNAKQQHLSLPPSRTDEGKSTGPRTTRLRAFKRAVLAARFAALVLAVAVPSQLLAHALAQAPATRPVVASELDPLAQLASAREAYEDAMDRARAAVVEAFDRRLEQVRSKAVVAEADLEAVRKDRSAFLADGSLPEKGFPAGARFASETRLARKRLSAALSKAASDLRRQEATEPVAKLLVVELEKLQAESDVSAWGPDLLASMPAAARRIASDTTPVAVELVPPVPGSEPTEAASLPTDGYRIEIRARTDAPGAVVLDIPLPGGTRSVAVRTLPAGPDGTIRVLLSVRGDHVSADLGSARPVLDPADRSDGATRLLVRSEGGSLTLESVRIKPIKDAPAEAQPAAERTPRPDRGAAPRPAPVARPAVLAVADSLAKGDSFAGSRNDDDGKPMNATATVMSVGPNRLVLHVSEVNGTVWSYEFAIRRDKVALVGSRFIRGNQGGWTRSEVSGAGSLDGDTLTFTYQWRVNSAHVRNQRVNGTFTLTKN